MCYSIRVCYSCGHQGRRYGKKACYFAKMIEAHTYPNSRFRLKHPVKYYYQECESEKQSSKEVFVKEGRTCGMCVLAKKLIKPYGKRGGKSGIRYSTQKRCTLPRKNQRSVHD